MNALFEVLRLDEAPMGASERMRSRKTPGEKRVEREDAEPKWNMLIDWGATRPSWRE